MLQTPLLCKIQSYIWHMTHYMWHVTHDTWHVTGGGEGNLLSMFQLPSFYGLGVKDSWRYFHKGSMNDWVDYLINKKGGCRTDPTTLGLLNKYIFKGTCDIWHVTCDTWHVTHDILNVTQGGGEHSLKMSGSWLLRFGKYKGWLSPLINDTTAQNREIVSFV